MNHTADAVTMPADWAPIWSSMLRVRAALAGSDGTPPSSAAAAVDGLAWRGAAGWRVKGDCSAAAAALFAVYKPLLDAATSSARPWLVAQLGQSLDGCIATASGDSHYVTGPHSLLHLHRLRALCDAVLVGAGTVAADDPQLTTRRVPGSHPSRIVLDPAVRLDGRARVLRDGQAPTLWLCDARHRERAQALLADAGAGATTRVLGLPGLLGGDGGLVPAVLVGALAAAGLRVIFVEGGGVTVSRFLAAGCLDRLHLVIAPVLIGAGRRGLQLPPRAAMGDCLRPPAQVLTLGEDRLWDLDLGPSKYSLTSSEAVSP
jgi:riboflavin-specific deaminase-like protein